MKLDLGKTKRAREGPSNDSRHEMHTAHKHNRNYYKAWYDTQTPQAAPKT